MVRVNYIHWLQEPPNNKQKEDHHEKLKRNE